ncbi:MAG: hypothetical protein KDD47_20450, partial [Acidobacteria bacterium]|nr:hypothetical protein [Acidobacteriota bacterium]
MALKFHVEGQIELETPESLKEIGSLKAVVLDRNGQTVGAAEVAGDGKFSVPVKLRQPADLRLIIGPDQGDEELKRSSTFSQELSADSWKESRGGFLLKVPVLVKRDLILTWLPKRVCISGHVRKIETEGETTTVCPVPFVKVEVFDVDRESCWWEHIRVRLPELLDRRVVRIPDLIGPRPLPDPFPIPTPIEPQPLPKPIPLPDPAPFQPRILGRLNPVRPLGELGVDRAAEGLGTLGEVTAESLVGEVRRLDPELQERLSSLTLTTQLAPWILLPGCFYSRQLVCTATTDEHGYWSCCFNWWPFYFRRGRLRFDQRPDIIVRVTQVVDGVEQVLYMDP